MTRVTYKARAEAVNNPYWTYLQENIPSDPLFGRWGREGQYTPEAFGIDWTRSKEIVRTSRLTREDLVKRFSWAIPSPTSLAFIALHLDGRPIVEMGAGTGYWAWMLTQMGLDVVAYDSHPPDVAENWFHSERETVERTYTEQDVAEWHERWDPMIESFQQLSNEAARLASTGVDRGLLLSPAPPPKPPRVGDTYTTEDPVPGARRPTFHTVTQGSTEALAMHPDRALMLCWPPYGKELAVEALMQYLGDTVVYIGEGAGGCCADDAFFSLLEHRFEEVAFLNDHTQWSGIHDYITIYRRKRSN